MGLKRDHTDAETEALAETFRESWSEGQVIKSWLRQHGEELRALVRQDDWSWENVGRALSKAGIRYKTNKPWDAEILRRCVDQAMKPKKVRAPKAPPPALVPAPVAIPASVAPIPLVPPRAAGGPEFKIIQRGPGAMNRDRNAGNAGVGAAISELSKKGDA